MTELRKNVYFFEFENTTMYYRQYSRGWMAYLPCSGSSQAQLLLTLSRTIANWRDAGCPPSGYPKGALEELDREPKHMVLMRHPLEICDTYERSAIARLLKVSDIDQVLYEVQRHIIEPGAAAAFTEAREFYVEISNVLLCETAACFPEHSVSEHIEAVGEAIAERFVKAYGMQSVSHEIQLQRAYGVHRAN